MREQPKIEGAPGLVWKPRKIGWEARWAAQKNLVKRGFVPKSLRIWKGPITELNEVVIAFIQDRSTAMQNEMHVWGRGGTPTEPKAFDGTISSLIGSYTTDPASPWNAPPPDNLRYVTKENYRSLMGRLEKDCGSERVKDIKARNIKILHQQWAAGGKLPMGHSMVTMLRTLVNFGASMLEDEDCERLSVILHRMKFKMGKPRTATMTPKQIATICELARARPNERSIGLAQAIQFECTWRQKDVIGEWVPVSEYGLSDVIAGNKKWMRGIRWEEIDANLVVKHVTSKKLKEVTIDLKNAPMVLVELEAIYPGCIVRHRTAHPLTKAVTVHIEVRRDVLPASGPVIVSEITGGPYENTNFRRQWRAIATLAGVPADVRQMDTRATAITEAFQAGVRPDAVRKSATHSNENMTGRYNRRDTEDIAEAMQIRANSRNDT